MWRVLALGLLVPQFYFPCFAQNVSHVRIDSQPLVYVRSGVINGCGVRLLGGEFGPVEPIAWFDVSFNIYAQGIGMIKALSYDVRIEEMKSGKRGPAVPVQGAWIKVDGSMATRPLKGISSGEDLGSIVYAASADDVFPLFFGLLEGKQFMVAIQRKGQSGERIYAGAPTLDEADAKRISSCLNELASSIK
jgi:hypothetical protein